MRRSREQAARAAQQQDEDVRLENYRVPTPFRRNVVRRTLVIFALVFLGGYVGSLATRPEPLAADCTTTRFETKPAELRTGGLVAFAFTGPAATYVVAVDAVSVRVDDGRAVVTPRPGTEALRHPVTKPITVSECAGAGEVSIDDTVTKRTVTLFRVGPDGTATSVGERQVEVTG
jgi:hypothetical protein